jgi:hypothetical protein
MKTTGWGYTLETKNVKIRCLMNKNKDLQPDMMLHMSHGSKMIVAGGKTVAKLHHGGTKIMTGKCSATSTG